MKNGILAIALVFAGLGTVNGLASNLNQSSATLGSSTNAVTACQSESLQAGFGNLAYSSSVGGYTLGSVSVSGVQPSCNGKGYQITLLSTAGSSLARINGTIPTQGASFTTSVPNVNVADISSISVAISG